MNIRGFERNKQKRVFTTTNYCDFLFMGTLMGKKKVQVGKDQEKAQSEKRFPLQKPRWEKTKLTIRYLYHETYRKPNEQLFSQYVATQLP